MISRLIQCLALAAVVLTLASCKDKNSTSSNNTTVNLRFVGTVNGQSGSLTASLVLVVDGANVTGTLKVTAPSASTVALTGTYNSSTKALTSSGSGYNFSGTYDGSSHLDGTMSGTASGTFVTIKDDNSVAIAYCGSFTGDDDGVWNFTVEGTTITGSYTTTSDNVGALNGTMSGANITINRPGGGTLAVGTVSGTNASGTWDDGAGNSGTWAGSRCN